MTGMARERSYWPKRFRDAVTPARLPDCGGLRIFIYPGVEGCCCYAEGGGVGPVLPRAVVLVVSFCRV